MLNWTVKKVKTQYIYITSEANFSEKTICTAIEACTEKAVSLLTTNIQDDSLYLLFEWDNAQTMLRIVVTDIDKAYDSPQVIECILSGLFTDNSQLQHEYTEQIKFCLHDYLTTCTAFFNYSLVAIFHSSTRNQSELL